MDVDANLVLLKVKTLVFFVPSYLIHASFLPKDKSPKKLHGTDKAILLSFERRQTKGVKQLQMGAINNCNCKMLHRPDNEDKMLSCKRTILCARSNK